MIKKIALALGTLGFLATGSVAFAQTASTTPASSTSSAQSMLVQISPAGKVLLHGTIDSVSANSITVKSWGGTWTVNVPTTASILPRGATLAIYQKGDYVGVQGTANQSGSWTIDAILVYDHSAGQVVSQEIKQNIQSVHDTMHAAVSGMPRTLEGTLSGLSGQSFTITTSKGAAYAVSLTSGAKLYQKNWLPLDFTQVQNGDAIRVWGPVSSSSVTASIFRDVSIPRK